MNWKKHKRKNIQNFNCLQDLTVKIIFTTAPVKITKQTMKEKNIEKFRAGREVSEQSPRFLKNKTTASSHFLSGSSGFVVLKCTNMPLVRVTKMIIQVPPILPQYKWHWSPSKVCTAPSSFHLQHHKNIIIEFNLDIINWRLWINIIWYYNWKGWWCTYVELLKWHNVLGGDNKSTLMGVEHYYYKTWLHETLKIRKAIFVFSLQWYLK